MTGCHANSAKVSRCLDEYWTNLGGGPPRSSSGMAATGIGAAAEAVFPERPCKGRIQLATEVKERQIAQLQECVLCCMAGEFHSWLECDSGFEVQSCGRSHSVDASSFRNALETGPRGLAG